MEKLSQHNIEELRTSDGSFPNPEPGEYVHHVEDRHAFGVVVARVENECEVLWSRAPVLIQIDTRHINATSRKLSARWTVSEKEPEIFGLPLGGMRQFKRPKYEVEEEYENLDYDEVKTFREQGADVHLHQDGTVTVKRETEELPEHFGPNDRVTRTSYRQQY